MTSTVTIVFAFRAQKKTVQSLVLTHGVDAIEPAGKHFVDITLVTDIHDKSITRCVEHAMQSNCQFDDAEIRAEMTTSLRQNFDQLVTHFLSELRQILFAQRFDIRGRTYAIKQARRI